MGNNIDKNWGNAPIVVLLSVIGSLIAIFAFMTGKQSISEIIATPIPNPTLTLSFTPTSSVTQTNSYPTIISIATPNLTTEDIRAILGLEPTTTIYKAVDGFFASCYDGTFKAGVNAVVLSDGSVTLNGQPTYSIQEIINAMVFDWPGNYEAFFFVKADRLDSLPRNVVIYAKGGPGGAPIYDHISPDEFKQLIINRAFPTGIDDLRIQYVR